MKVTITLDFFYKLLKTFIVVVNHNIIISKSEDYSPIISFRSPDKPRGINMFLDEIIIDVDNKTKGIKL
jgi:hypothetical protein